MKFESIKILVEGIKSSYKCPECNSGVGDSSIEILGTAGNTVNFDITCPKCGVHSLFSSQIIPLGKKVDLSKNLKLERTSKISDKEIVSLNNDLKKEDIKASDLFEDNNKV